MASTTLTVTTCNDCDTPVRPNKLRCDKCWPKEMDRLLDSPHWEVTSMSTAARNVREL